MTIFRQFTFDSAHFLPSVPPGHKCREIHGHTYRLTIFVEGPLDETAGWVLDFAAIKREVGNVVNTVDHKFLNNIEGLENPTCERLAIWLWNNIKTALPLLKRIELYETPMSGVIYDGS